MLKRFRQFTQVAESALPQKELLNTSTPMIITTLSAMLTGQIGLIALGAFGSPADAGIFGVIMRIAITTRLVIIAINAISAPKFAQFYAAGKVDELKKVVRFSARLIFFLSSPIIIVLLAFPGFLMGIFGEEFVDGKYALMVLALAQFINVMTGSVGNLMNMTGAHKAFRNFTIIGLCISLVLNIVLIPIWGVLGASVAMGTGIVVAQVSASIYMKRKKGLSTAYIPFISR